ncbi:MAG: hypothetical protein U0521_09140 [Anaerolineae bacterium]
MHLRAILADDRVLALAFDDAFGRMTVERGFGVPLIERYTDRVSPADGHPACRAISRSPRRFCRWCGRASGCE